MKFNGQPLSKMVLYVTDGQQNRPKKILRLIKKSGVFYSTSIFQSGYRDFSNKQKSTKERGFMTSATSTIRRSFAGIILVFGSIFSSAAFAAGAVEMQVESIIRQAMEEYNQSMENNDPAAWIKYFSDNVSRTTPLSSQSGKKDFSDYVNGEYKTFKARFDVKKMIVGGRSAAVVFTWDVTHRKSGDSVRIDAVGIYEMGTSGRFDSVVYYFDPVKAGKLAAELKGN
jgi:hypothetical protein